MMVGMRALVVEDDAFSCSITAAALSGRGVEVVGECRNGTDAVAVAAATHPEVLVTDLDLGRGPNGLAVAHVLRRTDPTIGVVLLTNHADPRSAGTSLKQVPTGTEYITKQSVRDIGVLVHAMERAVLAAPGRPTPHPATTPAIRSELTDAQMETLRLVAEGLSNAEIARRRWVTERGVERMIERLIVILGVREQQGYNRRMALVRAFEALARGEATGELDSPG